MGPGKETDLVALRRLLAPGERLLGLDVGKKTVGVAVSDSALLLATPVTTIRRSRLAADAAALKAFVSERRIGGLVIGLPVGMDGNEGPACQSVRQFAANIAPVLMLPFAFWDERLSTAAVTRQLIAADASRAARARVIDSQAAVYILQGALDRLAHQVD